MRYLVFNVAVFLALAYLIVGKDQTEPRLSTLPATQEIAPLQAVEKEAPPPTPRPIAKVTPKPMASDPQVQKVEPVVEKVQERDEAVAEPVAPVPSQETVLVDAKERSKQLREMVADMERMFAEKLTR
ncbi:hypothetical protein [Terasakiella pusilla]|uniref:hypothetical protein n=1 Tax=Terasakiella pusilla TaxID=64973 RepID=UPI003AA7D66A